MSIFSINLSNMILGACWILFILGILKAFEVFENHYSQIFRFCIVGLVNGITLATLLNAVSFWSLEDRFLVGITCIPFSIIMVQCVSWMYCIRIRSFGGYYSKHDIYIEYAPWIILLFQIPAVTLNIIGQVWPQYNYMGTVITVLFSAIICITEVYMFVVLRIKVDMFLEYRELLKNKLITLLKTAMVVLILLDISLMIFKILNIQLVGMLRALAYLMRINVLVEFYGTLLREMSFKNISNPSSDYHHSYRIGAI
eukprot:NODE_318_length_11118_cov_0.235049.p3 type:complete len:255 gc:universal NODE_318_length_11118_cov_0.235049:9668-8904(-)